MGEGERDGEQKKKRRSSGICFLDQEHKAKLKVGDSSHTLSSWVFSVAPTSGF